MHSFKFFLSFLFICFTSIISAQTAPTIQWQKALGGYYEDMATAVQVTPEGGYIVGGMGQYTAGGDITDSHGTSDFWLAKFTNTGNIEWKKSFGGSSFETAYDLKLTKDSGYIVVGTAQSTDGDVTAQHGNGDFWIVKLTKDGVIQWQKTFGGTSFDVAKSVEQTNDGGYIIAGATLSNNGDITGVNRGNYDGWIIKITADGMLQWQKNIGGTDNDQFLSVTQHPDGGYIATGLTFSLDGDITGNHGNSDWLVVKFSSSGVIEWQKCFGGTYYEEAKNIKPIPGGGFIIAGYTGSHDGNVLNYKGFDDFWMVKINNNGQLLWQKCLGGTDYEQAKAIRCTSDNGFVITGYSYSNNGDVSGNHGNFKPDLWVVKTDSAANIQWQNCYGGNGSDQGFAIEQVGNGYIVAGVTSSTDGDVTGYHDDQKYHFWDYWTVKLSFSTAVSAYRFIGNGNWSNAANWENGLIPPANIISPIQVYINPAPGGQCIIDTAVTIPGQSSIVVEAGAALVVNGNLQIIQ